MSDSVISNFRRTASRSLPLSVSGPCELIAALKNTFVRRGELSDYVVSCIMKDLQSGGVEIRDGRFFLARQLRFF